MAMGVLPVGSAVLALLLILFYATLILPTQWLKVERVSHAAGLGKVVLHISDLHMERLRISPQRLARAIADENPDVIAVTGDFMDSGGSFTKLKRYLRILQQTGKPCFAVLGNHDYHLPQPYLQRMIQLFQEYGLHLLRNEWVDYDGIQVVGIDDYCTHHDDRHRAYAGVDQSRPVFVLQHDPNLVLDLTYRYDYLVSGHFHGKQFNVPFLFHLFPMGKLPCTGIYKGKHHTKYGTYYISKGLGQSGYNARFLIRSEITVHML